MNPLRVWGSRGTKSYNAGELDEQLRALHELTDSLARSNDSHAAQKFPSVGTLRVRHGISRYPGNADSATGVVVAALKNLRSDRTRNTGAA